MDVWIVVTVGQARFSTLVSQSRVTTQEGRDLVPGLRGSVLGRADKALSIGAAAVSGVIFGECPNPKKKP